MEIIARIVVAGTIALLMPGLCVASTTINLTATADTFVVSGDPTHDYGGAGALQVSANASPNGELQTLLRFDTASAKSQFDAQYGAGQWAITAITLQTGTNFGTANAQPNNPIFNVIQAGNFNVDYMANDTWIEGTGTPSSPGTTGVTYDTITNYLSASDERLGTFTWTANGNTNPPSIPPATWSMALTGNFLSDVDAGGQVSLHLYAADSVVSYLFNSRSFGTSANRPTLIITADAIPEPSSLALLGCGVILNLRWRRRWRN